LRLAEHVPDTERLEQPADDAGLVLRRDQPATRTAHPGFEHGALDQLHRRHLNRAGGPRLAAVGRVHDLLVGGRLDEHVARPAARERVVRVGHLRERETPTDLLHLLLDAVHRLGALDQLLDVSAFAGC